MNLDGMSNDELRRLLMLMQTSTRTAGTPPLASLNEKTVEGLRCAIVLSR
jgi:hypothetical protein